MFKLRFPESDIPRWALEYSYTESDAGCISQVRPAGQDRGYLTRPECLAICRWKTRRSQSRCARNDKKTIRVITQAALATPDEALTMDLLRLLAGVEWPTASTLLRFCDSRPYPILDFRALWSLGYSKPPHYTMLCWLEYLEFTRLRAVRLAVPIRTIDRALWQYSKTQQR